MEGNITKFAEWNFGIDPEAAKIVLENASKIKINNPLLLVDWTFTLTFPFERKILEEICSWNTEFSQFLTKIWDRDTELGEQWVNADTHAVIVALNPELITETEVASATVETNIWERRGEMLIQNDDNCHKNIRLLKHYDTRLFYNDLKNLAQTVKLNDSSSPISRL